MKQPHTYGGMVDAALDRLTGLGLTERDFAELAIACADQAGASRLQQRRIGCEVDVDLDMLGSIIRTSAEDFADATIGGES